MSDEAKRKLAVLEAQKQFYMSRIRKVYSYVSNLEDENCRSEFKKFVGEVANAKCKVEALMADMMQLEIEINPSTDFDLSDLESMEDMVSAIILVRDQWSDSSRMPVQNPQPKARLPTLELPSFDGDIGGWPVFFETFSRVIHQNNDLSDEEKVRYLMGKLTGKAAQLVSGVPPTGKNYEILWNRLVEKFQNVDRLAKFYFHQIINFKQLHYESYEHLEKFLEKVVTSYEALSKLQIPNLVDFFMLQIAYTKLDLVTIKNFEMSIKTDTIPTFEELIEFIKHRVRVLDHPKRVYKNYNAKEASHTFVTSNANRSCRACNKGYHQLTKCSEFLNWDAKARFNFVKKYKICYNCLENKHVVANCKSGQVCKSCAQKHNTLIHLGAEGQKETKVIAVSLSNIGSPSEESCLILLPTAVVSIRDAGGRENRVRFLLDSGSQSNLITESCRKTLGLPRKRVFSSIRGLGDAENKIIGKTRFEFSSRFDKQSTYPVEAIVIEKISGPLPGVKVSSGIKEALAHFRLADENFDTPGEIDGILGAGLYPQLMKPHKVEVSGYDNCFAVESVLGFIVMGQVHIDRSVSTVYNFLIQEPIESLVKKFWELESFDSNDTLSPEERQCEELFVQDTFREETGRYVVKLPFRESCKQLGDSFHVAKERFLKLEAKLIRNPVWYTAYKNLMKEHLEKDYMSLVSQSCVKDEGYFIPHHGVRKDSVSTPLRIVLDASAKTSSGKSLNDLLCAGPKLQTNPIALLLRFRCFKIAMTADVKQMYLQIKMNPGHRKFQRLVWRFGPNGPLEIYELNRVAFGLKSSPFLAQRVIKQLVKDEAHRFPKACGQLPHNMYVDDLIFGEMSLEKAVALRGDVVKLFHSGGFELKKWASNSPQLLKVIPEDMRVKQEVDFNFEGTVKVLGLRWDQETDHFFFRFEPQNKICTKRNILSVVARLFDPLGLLSPLLLVAKNLIKELWKQRLDWDETPGEQIIKIWERFLEELNLVASVRIPRHVPNVEGRQISLIGFCDGSEIGYGAAIYVIGDTCDLRQRRSSLLCAKSRIVPIKNISIPRIELCGALLLGELMKFVLESLKGYAVVKEIWALTDSKIALCWIKSCPSRWQTFVSNRVTKIQECIQSDYWYYVPTKENPADIVSRGAWVFTLKDNSFWWEGPQWLVKPCSSWPITNALSPREEDLEIERKTKVVSFVVSTAENVIVKLVERCSSWFKLLRIICYILRFTKHLPRRKFFLATDYRVSEELLLKMMQRIWFEKEFKLLAQGKTLNTNLKKLSPFLENGLIRVGGRLAASDLPYNAKHPILLAKEGRIINLLVKHSHIIHCHAGVNLLISILRRKYWIIQIRSVVKKELRQCVQCFRVTPRPVFPTMAELPSHRVVASRAFAHCGIDYAGPFRVRLVKGRGQKARKVYLCLFVCMTTKAVHLEIATDLSTAAFVNAFKRFIARRGACDVLYSDNGTNFIGAKTVFDEIHQLLKSGEYSGVLSQFLAEKNIEWKFNPPSAPHFGGLWEAMVKCVKKHLFKSVGGQILTLDEFATWLAQIESLLNSRPLAALGESPDELHPLTPNHFLLAQPEGKVVDIVGSDKANHAWPPLLSQLVKGFWKRWRMEYLHQLQSREKWNSPAKPVSVGQVVIIIEAQSTPLHWPLGVIEELHPDKKGQVRVARVRTAKGVLVRPLVKLCPLPMEHSFNSTH